MIALIAVPVSANFAQTSSFRLKTADSLFRAGRYTQSFEHYEQIFAQKQYTPAMLLKMAYIQEGLGHIGKALYYLNLYFLATNDKTALGKMEELATKYNLEGYKASDADWLLSFYHDYHFYISATLAALAFFLLSTIFYTRIRLRQRPLASFIILIMIAAALFIHIQFGHVVKAGIITNPKTYVMSGPSAGASVKTILGDGHRVEVLGKKDVWLKVQWNDEVVYLKENCVQALEL
ncbi:MAG: hypothetical protein ACOYXT_28740 [Bacteroidota bacterium]